MKLFAEFLFYLHLLVILGFIILGLFLSPLPMLVLVIIHQLQLSYFDGCLLTNYEKKIKGIPKKYEFFQYTFHRIFGLKISPKQGRLLSIVIAGIAVLTSVIRYWVF